MGYLVIERQSDKPSVKWFPNRESLSKHFEFSDIREIEFIDESPRIPSMMEWPLDTTIVFKGDVVVPKPRYVIDGIEVP